MCWHQKVASLAPSRQSSFGDSYLFIPALQYSIKSYRWHYDSDPGMTLAENLGDLEKWKFCEWDIFFYHLTSPTNLLTSLLHITDQCILYTSSLWSTALFTVVSHDFSASTTLGILPTSTCDGFIIHIILVPSTTEHSTILCRLPQHYTTNSRCYCCSLRTKQ